MKKSFMLCLLALNILMLLSCEEEITDEVKPKKEVPDALAGTWLDQDSRFFHHPFDPLLYNAQTNSWFHGFNSPWDMDPDPGRGVQIDKNGEFIWTLIHDTGVGGCRSTAASYLKGTVVVEGEHITFHPSVRRAKYKSVCNPGLDYDKDESTAKFIITYEVTEQTDSWGDPVTVLKLINPDGSFSSFYK